MNRKILIIINNYVALPLKDRKSVKQIHDELFPKKTGVDTDKKREADLSNTPLFMGTFSKFSITEDLTLCILLMLFTYQK